MEGFKEDPSKLCQQELPQAFYGQNIGLIGFSSKGKSHKNSNLPGQDANYIKVVNPNHNTVIASIADGVGSCMLSHYGSSIATKVATEYLASVFHTTDIRYMKDKEIGDHIRKAMRMAREAVNREAVANGQLEYSYQSTLTTAIYDGDNLYFGHIGDDGIVVLTREGKLYLVTASHKGEEASSVYPLQAGENMYQVAKVEGVDGFVMATDGVLNFFVKDKFEEYRIYWPFIESALKGKRNTEQDFYNASGDMLRSINGEPTITDDITCVVVCNEARIQDNSYRFDQKEWDRMTAEYAKKRKKIFQQYSDSLNRGTQQIPIDKVGIATQNVNPEDKSSVLGIFRYAKDIAKSFIKGGKND